MARIPAHKIERIKQEVPLAVLVERKGIEQKRHGADLIGLCPFHDDHVPSLVIGPQKNRWHCLGSCQVGGSVIDWVMKAERVSFRHAVELLSTQRGVGSREWGDGGIVCGCRLRQRAIYHPLPHRSFNRKSR